MWQKWSGPFSQPNLAKEKAKAIFSLEVWEPFFGYALIWSKFCKNAPMVQKPLSLHLLDHVPISQPLNCSQEPQITTLAKKWPSQFLLLKWLRRGILVRKPNYGIGPQNGSVLEMLYDLIFFFFPMASSWAKIDGSRVSILQNMTLFFPLRRSLKVCQANRHELNCTISYNVYSNNTYTPTVFQLCPLHVPAVSPSKNNSNLN